MLCSTCSSHLAPVFVTDLDGTLADYHGHFFLFADMWMGGTAPTYGHPGRAEKWSQEYDGNTDLATFMGISKEEYRRIKLAYRQGGMKRNMPTIVNAVQMMRAIKNLGYEIWIATTRPYDRLDNIDPDTKFWLQNHHIPFDFLVYGDDKYDELIKQVDPERIVMVLEDLPDVFDDGYSVGLPMVQKGSRYNSHSSAMRNPRVTDLLEPLPLMKGVSERWKA